MNAKKYTKISAAAVLTLVLFIVVSALQTNFTNARDGRILRSDVKLLSMAMNGDKAGVQRLLKDGVDPNTAPGATDQGMTALMYASWRGHTEIVERLINSGADVNAVSDTGATALFYASYEGHEDIIGLLLDLGNADTDLKALNGTTALAIAVSRPNPGVVEMLASRGSACNIRSEDTSATPLMRAAVREDSQNFDALMHSHCDLEIRDKYGKTALFYAVQGGNAVTVRTLISRGANTQAEDDDGISVLQFAIALERTEIEQLIRGTTAF